MKPGLEISKTELGIKINTRQLFKLILPHCERLVQVKEEPN